MMTIVPYFLTESPESRDDGWFVETYNDNYRSIAREAAADFFNAHGGWEASWPIEFTLVLPDGEKIFEVELETVPEFYAVEIK
jgi:hypothetical protein